MNQQSCDFVQEWLQNKGDLWPESFELEGMDSQDTVDTTYYGTTTFVYQEVHSCDSPLLRHPPQFQAYQGLLFDRGFAGLLETEMVMGIPEDRHVVSGYVSQTLSEFDHQIPFIRLDEEANQIFGRIINVKKSSTENYGSEVRDMIHGDNEDYVFVGPLYNEIGPSQTETNALLFKTDNNISGVFAKSFGTRVANADEMFYEVHSIPTAAAIDGNGYVAAGFAENNALNKQALVVQLDQNGNVNWANTYKIDNRTHSEAHSIYPIDSDGDGLADNGFIVAGFSYHGTAVNGAANNDLWVMRLTSAGAVVWSYTYDAGDCKAFSIVQTDDNNDGVRDDGFMLCGTMLDGAGNHLLIMKLYDYGVVTWSKVYHRSHNDQGMSLVQHDYDEYALTGVTTHYQMNEQVYIVKFDNLGSILHSKSGPDVLSHLDGNIAAEDCANDILDPGDGSLFVVGSTCSYSLSGSDKGDIYSIRIVCDSDCRMNSQTEEIEVPHTFTRYDNTLNTSMTDVNNATWVHVEEVVVGERGYLPGVLCLDYDAPCNLQGGVVSETPERETVKSLTLDISPNPVNRNGELNINFAADDSRTAMIQVFDIRGREVYSASVAAGSSSHVLRLDGLAAGTYSLTFSRGSDGQATANFSVR